MHRMSYALTLALLLALGAASYDQEDPPEGDR